MYICIIYIYIYSLPHTDDLTVAELGVAPPKCTAAKDSDAEASESEEKSESEAEDFKDTVFKKSAPPSSTHIHIHTQRETHVGASSQVHALTHLNVVFFCMNYDT